MMVLLAWLGWWMPPGLAVLGRVLVVGGLLVWEHRLVQPDDLSNINLAFFNINSYYQHGTLFAGFTVRRCW
jgi:4-hydroxybenzoate polyprenyltransferase